VPVAIGVALDERVAAREQVAELTGDARERLGADEGECVVGAAFDGIDEVEVDAVALAVAEVGDIVGRGPALAAEIAVVEYEAVGAAAAVEIIGPGAPTQPPAARPWRGARD